MQAEPSYGILKFGVFELDLSAHELRKRGIRVKLQEQPFQVLVLLLEGKGEVVTREELRAKLWPGDTFVDLDHGLGSAMNKLREALGESTDNPRYIETLPRRGYRFIAPVEEGNRGQGTRIRSGVASKTVEVVPEEIETGRELSTQPAVAQPRIPWFWRKAGVATVVLAILTTGSLWLIRRELGPVQSRAGSQVLAVLPFVNLSSDSENDYFSDGLTEEIIQSLAVVEGLEVTSRTSSFALKGARLDIREIGGRLNATVLLEGSVRRIGDQLRVTAQLIRAADGKHIWSSTYDRETRGVLAIQEEIAGSIANALRLKLVARQRHYTDNMEAYDLYLRGRHALEGVPDPTRIAPQTALQYFEQAIAKDANYALAYAGVAEAFVAMEDNVVLAHDEAQEKAKSAAEKALELDPMLSETHTALALISARDYAWQEAERSFRRAIELNPNNALAHLELGNSVLVLLGRFDEGLGEASRAIALDPLSPYTHTEFAQALLIAGRYQEAETQARKSIILDPTPPAPSTVLARALYLQGRTSEALAVVQEGERRGNQSGLLTCGYARAGQREEALRVLQENLEGTYSPRTVPARRLALIYACLGGREHTLEHLEKMYAKREMGLPSFLLYPELAWMRSDPRFAALQHKVGLIP